ncbi:AAA family ATPase [Congregibacter variabilis]|uniref:AAA family ATPase n=1 Tax=Congregibacter variabilis TaxID=3081200 RepID=A0ABZ0I4C4_9GAMM|nr:AAA family ATPase [Congregibacter sp. IMCC43200]
MSAAEMPQGAIRTVEPFFMESFIEELAKHSQTKAGANDAPAVIVEPTGEELSDAHVIARIRKSKQGAKFAKLFDDGDISAYNGDHSAADLGLADAIGWGCGFRPEQMERIFDQSALGMRDKWTTRPDYRQRTIRKARSKQQQLGGKPESVNLTVWQPASNLLQRPLCARSRLLGDWMLRTQVSVITGPGGVGKSVWKLVVFASLAIGRDLLDIADGRTVKPLPVLLLNNEDDRLEVELRLRGIIQLYQLTSAERELLAKNLHIISKLHTSLKLCLMDASGDISASDALNQVSTYCAANGIAALGCDPLVSLHNVNENANGEMEQVMDHLRGLALKYNLALMVAHHVKKGAEAGDVDGASRGATAVINAARRNALLTRMTPREEKNLLIEDGTRTSYVRLDDGKQNYGLPSDKARWFRLQSASFAATDEDGATVFESVGVPMPVDLQKRPDDGGVEIGPSDILKHFDDEPTWPLRLTDHYGRLAAVFGVKSDQQVRKRLEMLPLLHIDNYDPSAAAIGHVGAKTYRIWRVRRSKTAGVEIHRELVQ